MACNAKRTTEALLNACMFVGILLLVPACGKKDADKPKGTPAQSSAIPNSSSEIHNAEICLVLDLGAHEYLGDLDFKASTGIVVLTIKSHDSGRPYPHQPVEALLNVVVPDGAKQIPLKAEPLPDDPEGKTSHYKASDDALKGLRALKGRLNLTIDGKSYLSELRSAH
jgi:hypothetical protein